MTNSGMEQKAYHGHGTIGHERSGALTRHRPGRLPQDQLAEGVIGRIFRYVFPLLVPRFHKYMAWPRNAFYARLLDAADISLGSRNRVKGINHIQIGHGFRALDHLWIDAIEYDRAGNHYKPSIVIGNTVTFGYFVHVAATHSVRIGNDVLVGSRVVITDHNHGIYKGALQSCPFDRPAYRLLTSDMETVVEDNVWIGDGVAILPGARIGKGSIIGANSVVNGTIPDYCIAAGIPARPLRFYDREAKTWARSNENDLREQSRKRS
jgi:acetyltransferase-like isoleucine patch superfamily enzyme